MAILSIKNKPGYWLLFISFLLFTHCNSNFDLSGYVFTSDGANTRFKQSNEWNNVHPYKNLLVDSDNYHILVASDTHMGGLINFNKLLVEARKPGIAAFVITGDVTTGKKEDYLKVEKQLPKFEEVPYFLLLGNHDLFFDGWKTFYEYFGSSTYYFTVQSPSAKDIYICLDSGSGTLGDKQLNWLTNTLANERNNYRNCIVFTHNNFFRKHQNINTVPLVNEIYVLLDLIARYQVNMVITGHDHIKSVQKFGNTTYLTVGTMMDISKNADYLNLSVEGGKLIYEFKKVQ